MGGRYGRGVEGGRRDAEGEGKVRKEKEGIQ